MSEIIEDYLLVGHDNGRTLAELSAITGFKHRDIRRMISDARQRNVILNMQDGYGYFIPSVDEDYLIKRWVEQEESRLKKHALSLRAARKKVKDAKRVDGVLQELH